MKTRLIFILTLVSSSFLMAQTESQTISLEDAIKQTLANNYQIKITKLTQDQVENQSTFGNAGLLPTLALSGSASAGSSTADIDFAPGIADINDAKSESSNLNLTASLNYVLFDGLGNIYTFKKLQSNDELANMQSQLMIESQVLQVVQYYQNALLNKSQVELLKEAVSISSDRLKRAKIKSEFGAISKLELLNAQVDLNNDSVNYINQKFEYESALRNLATTIGIDPLTDIELTESTLVTLDGDFQKLNELALSKQSNLLLAKTKIENTQFDYKIARSRFMPVVSAGLNYGYSENSSNTSIILQQNSLGLTGSLSLSWSLFDGGRRNIALSNAKIELEKNQLSLDDATNKVKLEIKNTFDQYQRNLQLKSLYQKNVEAATLAFQKATELHQAGQITSIEFRDAQLKLLQTKFRIESVDYQNVILYYNLKRLSGELVF